MKNISKIIWSEEAVKNLEEMVGYLTKKWTEREMKNFANMLEKQIDIIKRQPLAYPLSKKKNIRKAVMSKQISVYYDITGETLRIISLFDNRKNPDKLNI